MRACASLLSLALVLSGCDQVATGNFGFRILEVKLQPGYQIIHAQLQQEIVLSREAIDALDHGVPLTVTLDLELRDAQNLALLTEQQLRYVIRYLPLSEHYQLSGPEPMRVQTFPRLRHALAALADLKVEMSTGALAPGPYEVRTRLRLDNARMPAPMRLPALLSVQWHHNSEWSTWPFAINA